MDFQEILRRNQERLREERIKQAAIINAQKDAGIVPPPKEKPDYSQWEKPKKTKVDHNERAIKHLEGKGYTAVRVDYFDTRTNRSHDLLGVADILAMKEGEPPVLVQLTSASNHATRRTKIAGSKLAARWLSTQGRILLLSFKPIQVGKSVRYEAREEWL